MSEHKVLSKWTKSLAGQSNYLNLLQNSNWKSLLDVNDTANKIESYALQVVCFFLEKATLSTGLLVLVQQTPGGLWRIYLPKEM